MKNKHAVLKDECLYWIKEDERKVVKVTLPSIPLDIVALWWIGQKYGITHFWIYPECEYDLRGNATVDQTVHSEQDLINAYSVFATYEDKEGRKGLKFARVWLDGNSGHQVLVGYPHRGRWNWTIKEPLDILATVDYLECELGVNVEWSTSHVGIELLKRHTNEKWLVPSSINMRDIPYNHCARDFMFLRPLQEEDIGKWIHGIDKNASHGAAMQGLYVGVGTPEHIMLDSNLAIYKKRDEKEAGIYRIASYDFSHSRWNGKELPIFLNQECCTTRMLNFAIEQNIDVKLSEGWIFIESHKTLQKWSRALWDARQGLRDNEKYPYSPARKNAVDTSKTIMLTTGGSLASPFDSTISMPHANAGFVGNARVIQAYNILSFEVASKLLPFCVYSDMMLYASEEEDIECALPTILHRKDGLGGYKHVLSMRITKKLVEYSQFIGNKPGKMLSEIRRCVNGK